VPETALRRGHRSRSGTRDLGKRGEVTKLRSDADSGFASWLATAPGVALLVALVRNAREPTPDGRDRLSYSSAPARPVGGDVGCWPHGGLRWVDGGGRAVSPGDRYACHGSGSDDCYRSRCAAGDTVGRVGARQQGDHRADHRGQPPGAVGRVARRRLLRPRPDLKGHLDGLTHEYRLGDAPGKEPAQVGLELPGCANPPTRPVPTWQRRRQASCPQAVP
jgi:hypothetical protein